VVVVVVVIVLVIAVVVVVLPMGTAAGGASQDVAGWACIPLQERFLPWEKDAVASYLRHRSKEQKESDKKQKTKTMDEKAAQFTHPK
jgi:hypothetical protein